MRKNLTDLALPKLPPGYHWDSKTPNFGVFVGKKRTTWVVVKGKNRSKLTLGHYPAMSLRDARQRAYIELGSPSHPRTAPAFPEALDAFLAQDRWKARSRYEIERTLRRHFAWTRPIDKITYEDVAQAIENISAKSERAHALKDIKTFFNWCVPRYLPHSPCAGMKGPRYISRKRVLSDEELKAVWNAAEKMEHYGKLVQVLISTGQRVGQFLSFDPAWKSNAAVTFPPPIMKSGREHVIPLGDLANSLLPHLKQMTYQGKRKKELDHLSGVTGWTLHDIRRTFSTNLAQLKVPQHITEQVLDHLPEDISGVAQVYNQYQFFEEKAEAIKLWEDRLRSLVRPVV